jgi:hypothetical protein
MQEAAVSLLPLVRENLLPANAPVTRTFNAVSRKERPARLTDRTESVLLPHRAQADLLLVNALVQPTFNAVSLVVAPVVADCAEAMRVLLSVPSKATEM